MSRFSRYDTDEERLPEGMTRVGYDADTQVYTFRDAEGGLWESAPGNQYGHLTRVGEVSADSQDTDPFLTSDSKTPSLSWRHEMMPMLNFGIIISLFLLGVFWALRHSSGSGKSHNAPAVECAPGLSGWTIQKGDTCWSIADRHGLAVDDLVRNNANLHCDNLDIGSRICIPGSSGKYKGGDDPIA